MHKIWSYEKKRLVLWFLRLHFWPKVTQLVPIWSCFSRPANIHSSDISLSKYPNIMYMYLQKLFSITLWQLLLTPFCFGPHYFPYQWVQLQTYESRLQNTIFNDKSAILLHPGTRWNKNFASQRQNYAQKMQDASVVSMILLIDCVW